MYRETNTILDVDDNIRKRYNPNNRFVANRMQMKIERIKKKTTQQIKPNYGIEVLRPRNNTTEISLTPLSST